MKLDTATPRAVTAWRDPQRRGRLVIGATSLLLAAGYVWEGQSIPIGTGAQPGPGLWPLAVGIAWVLISGIVLLEAAISVQVGGESGLPKGKDRIRVIAFFALTVALVVLMPLIGTHLASVAYAIALVRVISELAWWKVLAFGTIAGLALPWLFISVLQVRLPLGPLAGIL